MQDQINRIDNRLARMEKMLIKALAQVPPAQSERMDEKQVIKEFGVSRHVLRRLRLGYKRGDGMEIPAMLFKWGHRNGRAFDYDRDEINAVLGRTMINQ